MPSTRLDIGAAICPSKIVLAAKTVHFLWLPGPGPAFAFTSECSSILQSHPKLAGVFFRHRAERHIQHTDQQDARGRLSLPTAPGFRGMDIADYLVIEIGKFSPADWGEKAASRGREAL